MVVVRWLKKVGTEGNVRIKGDKCTNKRNNGAQITKYLDRFYDWVVKKEVMYIFIFTQTIFPS